MSIKEKYEGKIVQIYDPFEFRPIRKIKVTQVLEENVLYGIIVGTDVPTAYYLTDGIIAEIIK